MKRKIFFASGIAILLLAGCNNKKASITPEVKNITESVYASGIIKSKNQYEVFSKTNSILKTLFVKEGTVVKKGDALFEIDNSNSKLSTENARLAATTADYTTNLYKLRDAKNAVELARKKLYNDSVLYIRQVNLWDSRIGSKVGGEKQRVAIARAMINDPLIIMGDEPTGNLDSRNSKIVFDIFNELTTVYKQTLLIVTHDNTFAENTHRIIKMDDGRIVS